MTFERADWHGLDMWCKWEKIGHLRKFYSQTWRENDHEEDIKPDG